ncbi:FG-GAP-like repeat-containing protein [Streptomyces yaizuensis]|uniref:VCBS repeat-containing protein n=1 Tax=Streptomyces yaizuensis TaxID=2989713 RepID=A0ABQ5NX13_9ACTN|nr:FG-GAP-like repeat-containing protein [Streptomyces sp. YSPA8]GLF94901.1 VCBS repeat-containing protein [Streptomyces sp. YSPA8]
MTSRSTLRRPALVAAATVVSSLVCALAAPVAAAGPVPQEPAPRKKAVPIEDFNGDGLRDVVVAASYGTVRGRTGAGFVTVLYGAESGPAKARKQLLHQETPGVPGGAEADDFFGGSLTTADLDRDGYSDLIVGAHGEDTGTAAAGSGVGTLSVIWGGRGGLQGAATLLTGSGTDAEIGRHTVAGDIDGDGAADVVTTENGRHLQVLSGPFDRSGRPLGGSDTLRDDGENRITDLAAGDITGDGRADLAATRHAYPDDDSFHTVHWKGTAVGPAPAKAITHGPSTRLQGSNLDIGDINKDGYEDLVVGRPHDGWASDPAQAAGGMITYVPGSASGPVGTRVRVFNQDSPGVPGSAEGTGVPYGPDQFGTGVTIGDIDGDGYGDVALGVPLETIGTDGKRLGAGTVVTLRGTRNGPTGAGAKLFSQDTAGVPGAAERWDTFGTAVKLADTDGDRRAELIVGARGENRGEGGLWVLRGTGSGITGKGASAFDARHFGAVRAGANLGDVINH